jgi:Caspase domain
MTQTVQATCPHCRNVLRIPVEWIDKAMRCKHCRKVIQAKCNGADGIRIAAPAPKAVPVGLPAVVAVGLGAPPEMPVGDPFGFDGPDAPALVVENAPKRRSQGRGPLMLVLMFLFLFVLGASGASFVVYQALNTPADKQVAKKDSSKTDTAPIKPNGDGGRPAADKDKGDVRPPSDDGKKDKDKKPPPPKDKDRKKDGLFPRRALLISVNNYLMFNPVHYGSPRDPFKNGYPGSSTGVLRDRLTSPPMNFRADQVIELSDAVPKDSKTAKAHPTQKSVIEGTIKEFVESCREQDRIIIFFAGHATRLEDKKSYLIPISGNVADPSSLIPLQWVYDQLATCKAQQKILILDVFRFSPSRGAISASGGEGEEGAMPEDFDKDLLNPPASVQLWIACQKEQNSVELELGSAFMQALCHSMQGGAEMKGISSPEQPIPIDGLVEGVNKRLKELLTPEKRTQVSRLTGKMPDRQVAYDKTQALPEALKLKPPTLADGDAASLAQVNKMLDEIKMLREVRESRAAERDFLQAVNLPPFSAKKLAEYKAEGYENISELHKKYLAMKREATLGKKEEREAFDKDFPMRAAYFEIVEALNESSKLTLREVLRPPADKLKKAIFLEQEPLGMNTFKLERTLDIAKAAAKKRDQETSKRWQANFDFAHARLLARLVYVIEYNYTLARIRADDLPDLAAGQTGWRVGTARKIYSETKTKNYAKEVKTILTRVMNDNPDTPWAILAQREKEFALGVQWRAKSD